MEAVVAYFEVSYSKSIFFEELRKERGVQLECEDDDIAISVDKTNFLYAALYLTISSVNIKYIVRTLNKHDLYC